MTRWLVQNAIADFTNNLNRRPAVAQRSAVDSVNVVAGY
jgi:hypothetical protein